MDHAKTHVHLTDINMIKNAGGIKAVVVIDNLCSSITGCIQLLWQPQQTADSDLDI